MPKKASKILERIRDNPVNLDRADFVRLARGVGFEAARERGKGSHTFFRHKVHSELRITLPRDSPVKACYVRDLREMIESYNLEVV